jgi:hypothetical protein
MGPGHFMRAVARLFFEQPDCAPGSAALSGISADRSTRGASDTADSRRHRHPAMARCDASLMAPDGWPSRPASMIRISSARAWTSTRHSQPERGALPSSLTPFPRRWISFNHKTQESELNSRFLANSTTQRAIPLTAIPQRRPHSSREIGCSPSVISTSLGAPASFAFRAHLPSSLRSQATLRQLSTPA